jgi:hypothetical protein
MDKHGMILYDVDKPQIGLNLFSDPLYRSYDSLLKLGRQIAGTSTGFGIYEFLGQSQRRTVRKKTYWRTVSLYGTDWRLGSFRSSIRMKRRKQALCCRRFA